MSYELIMEYYQQVQEIFSNNYFQEYGIIGLFLNSLLSATAIPIPTEILTSDKFTFSNDLKTIQISNLSADDVGSTLITTLRKSNPKSNQIKLSREMMSSSPQNQQNWFMKTIW